MRLNWIPTVMLVCSDDFILLQLFRNVGGFEKTATCAGI